MAKFYDTSALNPIKVAEIHYNEFNGVNKILEKYRGELKNISILDIGCGHLAIQTLLRHSYGQAIVGIDLMPPEQIIDNLRQLFLFAVGGGSLRWIYKICCLAKKLNIDLHDINYFKTLKELCPFLLSYKGLQIRYMDVVDLKFPDRSFDAVISFSAFEHILDVPKAINEIKRVLKDGGIAIVGIHLFASLSGGHYPEWSDVASFIPGNIPPWDHLRNPPAYTINSEVLNTHRESEFYEMFKKEFEIVEKLDAYEPGGRHLFTEEIRKELVEYSEEELFKKVIVLVVKK